MVVHGGLEVLSPNRLLLAVLGGAWQLDEWVIGAVEARCSYLRIYVCERGGALPVSIPRMKLSTEP